jgi:hypothetical protein
MKAPNDRRAVSPDRAARLIREHLDKAEERLKLALRCQLERGQAPVIRAKGWRDALTVLAGALEAESAPYVEGCEDGLPPGSDFPGWDVEVKDRTTWVRWSATDDYPEGPWIRWSPGPDCHFVCADVLLRLEACEQFRGTAAASGVDESGDWEITGTSGGLPPGAEGMKTTKPCTWVRTKSTPHRPAGPWFRWTRTRSTPGSL